MWCVWDMWCEWSMCMWCDVWCVMWMCMWCVCDVYRTCDVNVMWMVDVMWMWCECVWWCVCVCVCDVYGTCDVNVYGHGDVYVMWMVDVHGLGVQKKKFFFFSSLFRMLLCDVRSVRKGMCWCPCAPMWCVGSMWCFWWCFLAAEHANSMKEGSTDKVSHMDMIPSTWGTHPYRSFRRGCLFRCVGIDASHALCDALFP